MLKRFFGYVEIKTKITSLFAFLLTIAYLFASGKRISLLPTAVFFLAMFLFDLTTTAINNYVDTKTNHQVLQFPRKTALVILLVLFAVSALLGIYLVWLTDVVVLIVGALCFLCGVFYSYGSLPISRQAYGEVSSGVFYGLFIPFLLIYMNSPAGTIISYAISFEKFSFSIMIKPLFDILLLAVIPTCLTANIMLANNICDVEHDVAVKRFTLPYYLGKKALYLFAALYYIAYLSIPVMVLTDTLSPITLLGLTTLPLVQRNINLFFKSQIKEKTFIVSIQNFVIILTAHTFLIFVSAFLPI